jgi:ABC-2 type transport system permease protein
MRTIIAIETRLFLREPVIWLLAILLPVTVLLVVGSLVPATPDPLLGGLRFIDVYMPTLVVLTLAVLGVNTMPSRFAAYREKGVLRRLSTTPMHPSRLLAAHLVINVAVALISLTLLVLIGHMVLAVPLPRDPVGFVASFLLGMTSLFALGMIVAAVAPTAGTAAAMIIPVFAVVMFLGGVYFPRQYLPGFLQDLGAFAPPGVQGLQDAWLGMPVAPLPLGVLLAVTLVASALAARLFRWE